MWFEYDEKKLMANPNVFKVECRTLRLKIGIRIKMYMAWKISRSGADIIKILDENGLTRQLIGTDYYQDIINNFKASGFPLCQSSEMMLTPDYKEENPLLLSGKFERSGSRGIIVTKAFEKELMSGYPELSIEDMLARAGIDPVDAGSSRIRKIRMDIEEKIGMLHDNSKDFYGNNNAPDAEDYHAGNDTVRMQGHPYIKNADPSSIMLTESFYNEVYLIKNRTLEEIFEMYGLDSSRFEPRDRLLIHSKLINWCPTDEKMNPDTEMLIRIQEKRLQAMREQISGNFRYFGTVYKSADICLKRKLCMKLNSLPHDPLGFYTQERILELTGISRSTYYKILNDEEYGESMKKRELKEKEDLEAVRKVIAYKGFRKGMRQICMLMPKVTGKNLSLYRIRTLMNKNGIKTGIRHPSKNRKAMKELMERNRKANLLVRRFRLHRPNEVRLIDVTYLDYGNGLRAYGSASVDPVTGRLICFVISDRNDIQLGLDTLEAMDRYPAKAGAILHSDQGIVYMTDDFQAAVIEKDLVQSMSRRGNCWDNVPVESFFGHFKDECSYSDCETIEDLIQKVDEYSVYYNTERGMWDRMHMTPEEYGEYLENLSDEEFLSYLEEEEKRYLEMKQASAEKAVKRAREYKEESMKGDALDED